MIKMLQDSIRRFDFGRLPREYREVFPKDATFTNINREKIFAGMMIVINLPLLYVDYYNWETAYWSSMPGYRYLCYLHIIAIAAMLLFLLATRLHKINSPADVSSYHHVLAAAFAMFILAWSAAVSVADQLIHRDITAFIVGIFAVASAYLMRARLALVIFLAPCILLLCALDYLQTDPHRLKGYFINIGSIAVIAWVLSRIFYIQYIRDFINRKIIDNQKEILARQSKEDFLTGLFNRRYLEILLSQEFARASRYKLKLSVAMADIDHFKIINDTFSHQVGDEVLRVIAKLFNQSIRSFDIIARYGGEEFVLILPETDIAEAVMVCERIRKTVEDHDWSSIAQGLSVTISFGVTDDMSRKNYEKILYLADVRLYEAKNGGRNQVRF
ncbi:MAG TPA: GGDEF domain-containing protein [Spirochaetota bacterium]|nr:GGDEF domain-containing protein [Spirochaetota bacterium]